jgi:hypothetical protein
MKANIKKIDFWNAFDSNGSKNKIKEYLKPY